MDGNHLVVVPLSGATLTYYAGSAWDRGGEIRDAAAWDAYLAQAAARLRAPVTVKVGAVRTYLLTSRKSKWYYLMCSTARLTRFARL